MGASVIRQPSVTAGTHASAPGYGHVDVHPLGADALAALDSYRRAGGQLRSVFRVAVIQPGACCGEDLPDVLGRYHIRHDRLRFVPAFPFVEGLSYRATFDLGALGMADFPGAQVTEFAAPPRPGCSMTEVTDIFPSADRLPENLLRFYVRFSNPMQRGRAAAEISLLGPDGRPAPDVLYRAPVELWDRTMRQLTVLLDPGRLKRGVGPNRELGPPLTAGQHYTLVIGAGMTDMFGSALSEPVHKRFLVTAAVRDAIAIEQWSLVPPSAESRQALTLSFPAALDWALLHVAIVVMWEDGQRVEGSVAVAKKETQWIFTPAFPWARGSYDVRVDADIEDVCGNTVSAAFERPLRPGSELGSARPAGLTSFVVE